MDRLRAMAIFARVVDTGSMSAAARALGLSTSAVSQQIRALEADTGVVLLHRSTRRLTLTAAGSGFYEGCAEMLAAAERAEQRLAEQRDAPVGELWVTAPMSFASAHLGPALAPLLRANPQLTLRVFATDARLDLIESRIDLAIRVGALSDSSQVARRLAQWQGVLVASPAWISQNAPVREPEDLTRADFLLLTPLGEPQEVVLSRGGDVRRLRLKGRIASDSQQTTLALARLGLGIAREVDADVGDDLARGALARVLPEWTLPPVGVWAVTPQRDAQPAKVRHAIEALRHYLDARMSVVTRNPA
ncbi:LysR family transcriptional regulator [Niveibacterium umoris]|uniref:DNA-binding transcriptional LysR family regulator n=1 Tax=Niveibacterium umoris TaxID=1193620 RepID=A0A840BKQ0_9RHOO|nr:LysR family transcriptional regulator [Niveibacterium umoris]MBB4013560.1 DNA-binding transcriptional LysR family regulator [Niveibacterium umoris]